MSLYVHVARDYARQCKREIKIIGSKLFRNILSKNYRDIIIDAPFRRILLVQELCFKHID